MRNYMCIRWLINLSDSTKMHGATVRFIEETNFITVQTSIKSQLRVFRYIIKDTLMERSIL